MAIVITALAALAAAVAWSLHSWWWPYTYCRACRGRRGKGAGSRSSARFYNRCRRCGGSGEQSRHTARAISKATGRPIRGSKE